MALRESLFPNVPPFINFIPIPNNKNCWSLKATPPVDLHDQLWRISAAIQQLAFDIFKLENVGQKCKYDDIYPFRKKPGQESQFKAFHGSVDIDPFPNLHMLSQKDELWKLVEKMKNKKISAVDQWIRKDENIEDEDSEVCWKFIPKTFVLPGDWERLNIALQLSDSNVFWIVKPSHMNRGMGIRVINKNSCLDDLMDVKMSVCVQKYLLHPFLMANQLKFDVRVYVLVTSLDPLRIYIYKDGLVRFCSEKYNSSPNMVDKMCCHVTNPEVNKSGGKYVYNKEPNSCEGHKWRLKCFWEALKNEGVEQQKIDQTWRQIEDIVIKTFLSALPTIEEEFSKKKSLYNCYSLTGFDFFLDSDLKPHLLEVNTKPQLLSYPLDSAVNKPMVLELFKIVGFHLPTPVLLSPQGGEDVSTLFKEGTLHIGICRPDDEEKDLVKGWDSRLYMRGKDEEYRKKEFASMGVCRDEGIETVLTNLSPLELRFLIKSEEELGQCQNFVRIFPTRYTYQYFRFFEEPLNHSDKLLDAFEHKFHRNRHAGQRLLGEYCEKGKHLF